MMHFVRTFSTMRGKNVRLIVIKDSEEVQYYEIIAYNKNIFENDWWEDAYSSF